MNKNFRIIWSHIHGDYIVTSELARGKAKSTTKSSSIDPSCHLFMKLIIISAVAMSVIKPVYSAPSYGEYVSGAGNILNLGNKDVATSENGAHGVLAEKSASAVINNVNVSTSGEKAYTVYAAGSGTNIKISGGSVQTLGLGSHGLVAGNNANLYAENVKINTTGIGLYSNLASANAKGLDISSNRYGVYSTGKSAVIEIADSNVYAVGSGTYGALAENGSKILSTNVNYTAEGEGAFGVRANSNSQIDVSGGTISSNGAHGVYAEKGSSAVINDVHVSTSGDQAYAVYAAGQNTYTSVSGGSILTSGIGSHGLVAGDKANIYAENVQINTTGYGLYSNSASAKAQGLDINSNSYGLYSTGKTAIIDITESIINATGKNAYSALAENGSKIFSTNVNYSADGEGAIGIRANSNSQLDVSGGSISAYGVGSHGVVGRSAAIINLDNVAVKSEGYGIYSSDVGSKLFIADSGVYTDGANSIGIYLLSGAASEITNVSVKTSGDKSYAIHAKNKGSDLSINGGSLIAEGINSHGLVVSDNAVASVNNLKVDSTGYGIYANKAIVYADNLMINSSLSGVYALDDKSYISINNSEISGAQYDGGAVKAASSGAIAEVTNSKLSATGLNASGLVASYSGLVNAKNVDVNITAGGYGFTTFLNGKINVDTAKIKSNTGGIGLFAGSGGAINADAIYVEIDNAVGSDRESVGLRTSRGNTYYKDPVINVNDSVFKIMGRKTIGIYTANVGSEINLNNTSVIVSNGSAVFAEKGAATTVNLNNSYLGSDLLLDTGKDEADVNVKSINLNASNHSVLQGNVEINKTDSSSISLNTSSNWRGASKGLHNLTLEDNSVWNISGSSDIEELSVRNSTLKFDHSDSLFQTLTVKGNYLADNASLIMNLALSDDKSNADKLHILGNSSGSTHVQVLNAGGKGAKTLEGIELIQIDGVQSGEFKQDGRIVAGAWDYTLAQDNQGQWRLFSSTPEVPPGDGEGDESGIIVPVKPQPGRTRPEVGSYLANLAAANNMFLLSAADRPGITEFINPLTGKSELTSMWLRSKADHGRFTDSTGQLSSTTNTFMTQLGGDVAQWSSNGIDRFSLGVMAGYGNAKSNTTSKVSGYNAKGQINGYSAGINASWQQDSVAKTGSYVDSWVAYGKFNNSVKGEGIGQESYNSAGFTTSIESGYTFTFGELQNYRLQPKAQIIRMGVKTNDYVEQNGTRVSATGNNNVQTRLGMRAEMKNRHVSPYAELNWLHNSQRFGSTLDDVKIEQAGTRNIGEAKLGLQATINNNVDVWSGVAQQIGGNGFSGNSASLGLKVSF